MKNRNTQSCESCLMPFEKDTGVRESERYCSLCYNHGTLCYQGTDRKEFERMTHKAMIEKGMNPIQARVLTFFIRFAPRWKK